MSFIVFLVFLEQAQSISDSNLLPPLSGAMISSFFPLD